MADEYLHDVLQQLTYPATNPKCQPDIAGTEPGNEMTSFMLYQQKIEGDGQWQDDASVSDLFYKCGFGEEKVEKRKTDAHSPIG